ncbi:MAG TPA: site-specific integrase [Terracidiphilus sp.]|nr:site-specific integrase [Terracidiphilus sp.]
MSIYKRGGVYWYTFVFEGKRIQQSTKQGDPSAARTMEAAEKTRLAMGLHGLKERKKIPRFKDAMTAFLKWHEGEHADKPATFRRHQISSVALLKYFRDKSLDEIEAGDVEKFKTMRLGQFTTARAKEGRKTTKKRIRPATVNRELALVRAIFNHVAKDGVILKNPVGPKNDKTKAHMLNEQNEQTRVLSYDEEARYLAAATPLLRDVATIILETGMRPEEVYRIEDVNVHLAKDCLFVPFGKTRAAKRQIRLTARAKEVLTRRMKARRGKYLFPHESDPNRPVPKVNNAHDRAVKDSGIAHAVLYSCRHTFATRAVEAGVDLVTLAAILGHSKLAMVLRYAHVSQKHQTEAIAKVEEHNTRQLIVMAEKTSPVVSQAIQ